MEVLAVSHSTPKHHDVNGLKLFTSIIHDPLTSPSDYIELHETGVLGNKLAAHDGPVYIFLAENYAYWQKQLEVDPSSWGLCHWGENITVRLKDKTILEDEIRLGDVWKIGDTVRLEVCGSRIPCQKIAWRCGQKDSWLQSLAASGRVGFYLRVLTSGRVHPGDQGTFESFSHDAIDVATISRVSYDTSLKTKDTLNILANHKLLLRMNKYLLSRKLTSMEDEQSRGKNVWKGWRDLRPFRIVDEGGDIKSFHLRPVDGEPLANFLPGQFLTIRLPNGKTRSWTISDWLERDGPSYYRISIKKAGGASAWMHDECTLDTVLSARSPAGRFYFDWTSKLPFRKVYLSAGIGMTPILAMMKAHDSHPNYQAVPALWVHVARNGASFPFQGEIPRFENRPFEKMVFFTDPGLHDVQGVHYDQRGRPDMDTLKSLIGAPFTWNPLGAGDYTSDGNFSAAHICGPPEFEKSMRECLESIDFRTPLIHSESFSASGAALGGVKRAKVRFTKSKVSATWTQDDPKSLLELAESLGLAPDYGCRVGACGSCAAKLTCGSVTGGVQADGTVLTCSASPASDDIEVDL
ncbi:Uu.00g062410.m01.CDS01 [Anthostomella pinea]|uniref:Uu.00g062410.m01.CDS01 n=1 Tax=Anthostomella pinea TaxID=933095 RepID=A0AAI8VML2_9PEZI|nr:Uu.00g062410.m01.CDS01 [Anthostomella pinea]